jgi:molybdopterin/thiamine biosynthesis adenylyltransferase
MVQIISERYHRQELIEGWDQEKLSKLSVVLIGSGRLSDLVLVDLLSLGIGNIDRIGDRELFDYEKITPDVYLDQQEEELSNLQLAELTIGNSDFIIDATNDLKSKFFSSKIALNKNIPYLSASCSLSNFLIWKEKDSEQVVQFHNENQEKEQGNLNSIVCSAILTEELRKRIMPLKDDIPIERLRFYDIREPSAINKKILQVGAGAIGTFSSLALSLIDTELTIIDFDFIEQSNLNRQFLFYDSVGKNKAEVLSNKLSRYSNKVKGINKKVEEDFNPNELGEFDLILSCVDDNKARYYMNLASKKFNIPLINGGSSISGGHTIPYFPGKTACLNCQTQFKLNESIKNEKKHKRTPGECFNPSLITSNQVVGGLMINTLIKAFNGKYEKTNYSSGFGIFNKKVNPECFKDCK